jgi:hypothetical protein
VSWSFVGSVTTDNFNGVSTVTVHLPASVHGGDLVVVAACMTGSGATCTVSIPGFTTVPGSPAAGGAKGSGSFSDQFWVGTHTAGGAVGGATTDTTYTATFNESAFGELVTYVLRSTLGGWTVVGGGKYNGNSSGTYSTACPDAVYTPTSSSNATIWGYAGQNSSLGTTASSFSGTGVSALSNFVQQGITANGGGVGMGWIQSTSAPGGATANQAVDATDFALEVAESSGASPAAQMLPQNQSYRKTQRYHGIKRQQPMQAFPAPAVTVTAGLATASGAAQGADNSSLGVGLTPVLATGTGTSQTPGNGITTGLATGTGAAKTPGIGITPGLATGTGAALGEDNSSLAMGFTPALATGTGTAQTPENGLGGAPGLASGTGAANAPNLGFTPGLPAGTGAAQAVGGGWTTGLSTGMGTAQFAGPGLTPALSTATSNVPAVSLGLTLGLPTALGTAQAPDAGLTPGLATGTGAALPALANQTGPPVPPTPQNKSYTLMRNRRALGRQQPMQSFQAPPAFTVTAGLASASGAAQGADNSNFGFGLTLPAASGSGSAGNTGHGSGGGLATGTGAAGTPGAGLTPGLATGTGTAQPVTFKTTRSPLNLGGSATPVFPYNASFTELNYGGSVSYGNPLGGSGSPALNYGGSATLHSLDATSGGTATILSSTLGGSVSYGNTLGGSLIGWTMQQVNLTLAENNDESVNFAITSNSSALDISTATINVYFKTAAGTTDGSALMFSSGGGSPAITITNGPGGLCTLAIPHSDLYPETYTFCRLDVVFSGLQNTAIYGNITWVTL